MKEYLNCLSNDEKKVLKEDLLYNSEFEKGFESALKSMALLLAALITDEEKGILIVMEDLLENEFRKNLHVEKMQNFYLEEIPSIFADYAFSSEEFEQLKCRGREILDRPQLLEDLNSLDIKDNNKNKKI